MKKKHITEHANIKKLLPKENKEFFNEKIIAMKNKKFSHSKIQRHIEVLSDIYKNNGGNIIETEADYLRYYDTNSRKEKLRIRKGNNAVLEYEKKLKSRPKPNVVSLWTKEYWVNRGYSETDAIEKVSEIQTKNVLKRSKESYKEHRSKLKFCLDYWKNKGFDVKQSEQLRTPFLLECKNDLSSMIRRHGDSGHYLYHKRVEAIKKSLKSIHNTKRTGGYVSIESKRFFTPIYKHCRRLGIKREDIYYGARGSREFFVRKSGEDNIGRFVDFCIPKLRIVVEYHGTHWHYRKDLVDKNPLLDYDDIKYRDEDVRLLVENRGFEYHVVWSDDNLTTQQKMIRQRIERLYDRYK